MASQLIGFGHFPLPVGDLEPPAHAEIVNREHGGSKNREKPSEDRPRRFAAQLLVDHGMNERLEWRQTVWAVPDWTDLLDQFRHDQISAEVCEGIFAHGDTGRTITLLVHEVLLPQFLEQNGMRKFDLGFDARVPFAFCIFRMPRLRLSDIEGADGQTAQRSKSNR